MPYKTGEAPMVGDKIRNTAGRQARVTEVRREVGQTLTENLTIKWDHGVVAIENYHADEFVLISRSR